MPVATTDTFKSWFKANTNMKLASDAAVLRITHEGVTDWTSLVDFDRKSIESLGKACSKTIPSITADAVNGIAAEAEISSANLSSISIRRLVIAMHAANYYTFIERIMTAANIHYSNLLLGFKTDYEAYALLREQDGPKAPLVNDKDKEKKVIKWTMSFEDALSRFLARKAL